MFELVLQAPESLVEPVSDALMEELDALSVSVEDSDADTEALPHRERTRPRDLRRELRCGAGT